MRSFGGFGLVRSLGALCGVAGFLAWVAVAWEAMSGLDALTAESEEGGRLMFWGVVGTVLMIVSTVLLHLAVDAEEPEGSEGRPPAG